MQLFPTDDNLESVLVSKNGVKWNTQRTITKHRGYNFVTSTSGVLGDANNVTTVKETFELFLSNNIINEIVDYTIKHCNDSDIVNGEEITANEIKAFISVLIVAGRSGGRTLGIRNLWDTHPLFKQFFFFSSISRDRFTYLYRKIRFDDKSTRAERFSMTGDKFGAFLVNLMRIV